VVPVSVPYVPQPVPAPSSSTNSTNSTSSTSWLKSHKLLIGVALATVLVLLLLWGYSRSHKHKIAIVPTPAVTPATLPSTGGSSAAVALSPVSPALPVPQLSPVVKTTFQPSDNPPGEVVYIMPFPNNLPATEIESLAGGLL
jgi:hypothetical protein